MWKFVVLISLCLSSLSSYASPLEQMMSVKERLRLSLWVEGISDQKKNVLPQKQKTALPEEIERALRKL